MLSVRPCNCTIVIFHHIRKCAGVVLRDVLQSQRRALGLLPERFSCTDPLGHAAATRQDTALRQQQAGASARRSGAFYVWEKHCGTHNLAMFWRDVASAWDMVVQRGAAPLPRAFPGCQLFAFTVLRHPVRRIESDYFYFVNDWDHINMTLLEFARLRPEELLVEGTTTNFGLGLPMPDAFGSDERDPARARAHELHEQMIAAKEEVKRVHTDPVAMKRKSAWMRQNKGRLVDRVRGPWAPDRLAGLRVLELRAAYIAHAKAAGALTCDAMLERVEPLLANFGLVGISERLSETLVLLADELGLVQLGGAGANANVHPHLNKGSAAFAEIAAVNECAVRMYEHAYSRFDAIARSRGKDFAKRAAAVHAELKRHPGKIVVKRATVNATPKQLAEGVPGELPAHYHD